jgi:hypothetical protein
VQGLPKFRVSRSLNDLVGISLASRRVASAFLNNDSKVSARNISC